MDMPLLFMQKNQKRIRKTGRRDSAGTAVRNWSNLLREGRKSSVMRTAGGNGGNSILKKLIENRMLSIREPVRIAEGNSFLMGTRGAGIAPTLAISMTASGGRKRAGRHTLAPTRRLDDR